MKARNDCRLHELVEAWMDLRGTPGRLQKRARLQGLLAHRTPEDLRLAASYLAGEIPQGSLQIGWSALLQAERGSPDVLPLFGPQPEIQDPSASTLRQLDTAFAAIQKASGPGAAKRRQTLLRAIFQPLTREERLFLRGLLLGELRQGALRALVLEAVAEAFGSPVEALRRAVMFAGSLGEVLQALARDGVDALGRFGPRPGVPVEPMLAAQAEDLEAALADCAGGMAVEWKLDGVRIQLHKAGNEIRVFSRQLRDVTAHAPEAVQLARALLVESCILDGELIALDQNTRPVAFQDLMSRFSRGKTRGVRRRIPAASDLFGTLEEAPGTSEVTGAIARVVPLFFDVLEWDGESRVDQPYTVRRAQLLRMLPVESCVFGEVVQDVDAARAVYDAALAAGHEGVVLKKLDAPYTAGRRGAAWSKVKPAVTLDLVILAAEWGHGRRQGLLSNLHLGARDETDPGTFHMLGKTFKGLTDAMLRRQTRDLLGLETKREGHVVFVRPEHVVEVAFDGVQRSRRYASGFALRFARVKRFRPDKPASEASTLEEIRALHESRT